MVTGTGSMLANLVVRPGRGPKRVGNQIAVEWQASYVDESNMYDVHMHAAAALTDWPVLAYGPVARDGVAAAEFHHAKAQGNRPHADLRRAAGALSHIAENEMALHVGFCAGWGIDEAQMAATPEDPANMAYTRYVLERGLSGDALDLAVALAPCIVGYAEIGAWLTTGGGPAVADNPYQAWVDTYGAQDYQDVARGHADHLDQLMARRGGPGRFEALAKTFGEATRLEIGFWRMGLDAAR